MNLIELAQEKGLQPRRTAATNGGEYHCSCPNCGGKDRFAIWPNQKQDKCTGRYWCRQCQINGDAIKFCREFFGLSWEDSIRKLNLPPINLPRLNTVIKKIEPKLAIAKEPPVKWKEKALQFINQCHQHALKDQTCMEKFYERGLNDEIIQKFKLGYSCNPVITTTKDMFCDYADWGLEPEMKEDCSMKRLWFPHGQVIPCFSDKGEIAKINIRRLKWYDGDKFGKYIKVAGGMNAPAIYGNISTRVAIILESEFDAILIQQFAADLCFCIATGGSTHPLDLYTDHLMRKALLLLICPDVDVAGAKFLQKIKESYKHSKLWPAPLGKSPGDAFKDHKIDLRQWILQGLPEALKPQQKAVSYPFTCKNCRGHNYWISIFETTSCMQCVDPNMDNSLVRFTHIEEKSA
jgi:hypothetical protein